MDFRYRDGHGARIRPASSAEKKALIGFQQIEANPSQLINAESTLQGPATHLQGYEIGRERPEHLLQHLTACKGAV